MNDRSTRGAATTDTVLLAGYFAPSRTILVGSPLLGDGRQFAEYMENYFGADPRMTRERVLYHEMIHAYDEQIPGVADSFLDLGFREEYLKLHADPRLPAAPQKLYSAQESLRLLCEEGRRDTSSGYLETLERILEERPDLREIIHTSSRTIREIMSSHGLPSRYPGDAHAGGDPGQSQEEGGREYFAIVWETARHEPEEFMRWRRLANDDDPNNDILSPVEIRWMDEHPWLRD